MPPEVAFQVIGQPKVIPDVEAQRGSGLLRLVWLAVRNFIGLVGDQLGRAESAIAARNRADQAIPAMAIETTVGMCPQGAVNVRPSRILHK